MLSACWKKRVNNRKALKIKFNGIYSLCDDDGGGRGDGVDRQLVRMGCRLLVRGCKGL